MSVNIPKELVVGEPYDISEFTHKSLSIIPDGGSYNVDVSNDDGDNWLTVRAAVVGNTLIRSGHEQDDLPFCAGLIRITENAAGTSPRFSFFGHNPV